MYFKKHPGAQRRWWEAVMTPERPHRKRCDPEAEHRLGVKAKGTDWGLVWSHNRDPTPALRGGWRQRRKRTSQRQSRELSQGGLGTQSKGLENRPSYHRRRKTHHC